MHDISCLAVLLLTALFVRQIDAVDGSSPLNERPRPYNGYELAHVTLGNPTIIDRRPQKPREPQPHPSIPDRLPFDPAALHLTNPLPNVGEHVRHTPLKRDHSSLSREKRAFKDPCNPSQNVRYIFNDTLREGWTMSLTNRTFGSDNVNATVAIQSQTTLCGSSAIEFTTDANFLIFNTTSNMVPLFPLYRYLEFYVKVADGSGSLRLRGPSDSFSAWAPYAVVLINGLVFLVLEDGALWSFVVPSAVIEGWILAEGKGWQHVGIRLDTYLKINDSRSIQQVAIYQQTATNYTRKSFFIDQIRFSQEEYIWTQPVSVTLYNRTQYNVDKPKMAVLPDHSYVVAFPRLHIGTGVVTAFDLLASLVTENGTVVGAPAAIGQGDALPFTYDAMMDTLDLGLQADVLEVCTDPLGRVIAVAQDYRRAYPDLAYSLTSDGVAWSPYRRVFPPSSTPSAFFDSLVNFTSAFASLDQQCNLVVCYSNLTRRAADQDCFFARYSSTPREEHVLWDAPALLPMGTWTNESLGREYPANIVTIAPNVLLVTWSRSDYVYKDGVALFITSEDNGNTWGKPRALLYEPNDYMIFIKPSVASNNEGHVVLVYNAANANITNWPNIKVFWSVNQAKNWTYFWISTDYFQSFDVSPSIAFDACARSLTLPFLRVKKYSNRNWVVAYNSLTRRENNPIIPAGVDPDILYVHSIADGSTWTVGELANIDGFNDDAMYDLFPSLASDKRGGWGLAWVRFYNDTRHRGVEFSTCFIPQSPEGFTCTYDLGRCEPTTQNLTVEHDTLIPGTLSARGGQLNITSVFGVNGDAEVAGNVLVLHGNVSIKADLTLSDDKTHLDVNDGTVSVQGNLVASGGIEFHRGFLDVQGCLDGDKANLTIHIDGDDLEGLTPTHNVTRSFAHFACISSAFHEVTVIVSESAKSKTGCEVDAVPSYASNSLTVLVSLSSCTEDETEVATSDWMAENGLWLWPVLCLIVLVAAATAAVVVIRKNRKMRHTLMEMMHRNTSATATENALQEEPTPRNTMGRVHEII